MNKRTHYSWWWENQQNRMNTPAALQLAMHLIVLWKLQKDVTDNSKRTEQSPICSVIIQVIKKLFDDHEGGVWFVNHEYEYRQNYRWRHEQQQQQVYFVTQVLNRGKLERLFNDIPTESLCIVENDQPCQECRWEIPVNHWMETEHNFGIEQNR